MTQSRQHFIGQIQRPGQKPENVRLVTKELANITRAERSAGIEWVDSRYEEGNVFRYGAIADWDGSTGTDNQDAFQKAINVAEIVRGQVFIPAGFYKLSSGITVDSSDVTISGEGPRISRLHFDASSATCLTLSSTQRVWLRGFGIEGSTSTNQPSIGLHLDSAKNGVVENVRMLGMSTYGIHNDDSSWSNRFIRCLIDSCDTGIKTGNNANSLRFESCSIEDPIGSSVSYAVEIGSGANGLFFDQCEFEGYANAAILLSTVNQGAAVQVKGINFNHLYTEIPDNSLFMEIVDQSSPSRPIFIEKMVFSDCHLTDLESTSRTNWVDMTMLNSGSFAWIDVNSCFFGSANSIDPSNYIWDIDSKVRIRISQPRLFNITLTKLYDETLDTANKIESASNGHILTGAVQYTGHLSGPTYTQTELRDITDEVNTHNFKTTGAMVFDSTNGQPVWAAGSADGSVWVDATGTTLHTPV